MCYLLQGISRNATDWQKWNVLDAMINVIISWDKVSLHVIVNHFAKEDFGTKAAKKVKLEQDDPSWAELWREMDCLTNFQEFISADGKMSTFEVGRDKEQVRTPLWRKGQKKMRNWSLNKPVYRGRRHMQRLQFSILC